MAGILKFLIEDGVKQALFEDLGRLGDITSQLTIVENNEIATRLVAREKGVLAGIDVVKEVYRQVDEKVNIDVRISDGEKLEKGFVIAEISGNAGSILTAERVALNFLCHMSGIASLTYLYVMKAQSNGARICCTRKTLPGLRAFQKYAVRIGGGYNHRYGLDDAVLIKDNHIAAAGGVKKALSKVKAQVSHMMKIEIEVDNLEQLAEVIEVGVDVVLLDNMNEETLRKAVEIVKQSGKNTICEASGGVSLENVEGVSQTGVDYISVGALTHSAKYLDIGLDFYK